LILCHKALIKATEIPSLPHSVLHEHVLAQRPNHVAETIALATRVAGTIALKTRAAETKAQETSAKIREAILDSNRTTVETTVMEKT